MKFILVALCAVSLVPSVFAGDLYVSISTGNNSNPGTKAQPIKDLHKAIDQAKPGDSIHVAEGTYEGRLKSGYYEIEKSGLKLIGGYKADFSSRSPFQTMTKIQDLKRETTNGTIFTNAAKKVKDITVDGFVIDKAEGNVYGDRGLQIPGVNGTPAIRLQAEGEIVVQNCMVLNNPGSAIQIDYYGGNVKVRNNLLVNNYNFGIAVEYGGSGASKVEILSNTVAFSSREDSKDTNHGAGIEAHTSGADTTIKNNMLAYNDLAGLKNYRGAKGLNVQGNNFFGNKSAAYVFYMKDGNRMPANWDELGDADLKSESANAGEDPKFAALDQKFVKNWLSFSSPDIRVKDTFANAIREVIGGPYDSQLVGGKGLLMPKLEIKNAMLFASNPKVKTFGAQMAPVK